MTEPLRTRTLYSPTDVIFNDPIFLGFVENVS